MPSVSFDSNVVRKDTVPSYVAAQADYASLQNNGIKQTEKVAMNHVRQKVFATPKQIQGIHDFFKTHGGKRNTKRKSRRRRNYTYRKRRRNISSTNSTKSI
jgi:tRNA(Ile2) C34 agmatinyltransferase TiaS